VIFFWAARVIDAWLGLPRGLQAVWRALPGDLMGLLVIRACGIPSVGREVRIADIHGDRARASGGETLSQVYLSGMSPPPA
jgi:hypothetical protein